MDVLEKILATIQSHINNIYQQVSAIVDRINADAKALNRFSENIREGFDTRDKHVKEAFEARDEQTVEIVKVLNERIERLEMLANELLVNKIEKPKKLKQIGNA